MTSAVAIAACSGAPTLVALAGLVGPPSITATEASTDQALELIRKRREEASGACPAGFVRSGGNCIPANAAQPVSVPAAPVVAQAPAAAAPAAPAAPVSVTTTTTTGQAAATAATPPGAAPRPKQAAAPRPAQAAGQQVAQAPAATTVRSAQAPQQYSGYAGGSIKDSGYPAAMPGSIRAHGVWVEGFYDYEKHSNLNPQGGPDNNPTRRLTSSGVLSGIDVSNIQTGGVTRGVQLGAFGGYNSTRGKFSDTTTITTNIGAPLDLQPDTEVNRYTNVRQEMEGAMVGAYASAVHGALSGDVSLKVDLFDIERRFDQLSTLFFGCNGVNDLTRAPDRTATTSSFGTASVTNVTVASNVNYRFQLSSNHYLEPTVGVRWTNSDFGGNAAALGLRDGDVFRVQGGLRFGMRHMTPDGWIWNTALTGLLYSDVSINGYTLPSAPGSVFSSFNAQIDEGKLRAMGMLETRVDVGYGYTLYGAAEVRGGEDLIGYGGRLGVRYQW